MLRLRPWVLIVALSCAVCFIVVPKLAQAQDCGPICARPGHYVLCSDSFDSTSAIGGSFQLGFDEDDQISDRLCVGHPAPASSYNLRGAYMLLTAGDSASFCLELFEESFAAAPTRPIAAGANARCFMAGLSNSVGWVEFVDPTRLAAHQNLTDDPRVCLIQQVFASQRHVTHDGDGAAGHNTVYLIPPSPFGWALASARGMANDFILRPIVELADLSPWQPGGACSGGTSDAGPGDASGTADASDAGAIDAELPETGAGEDTGTGEDAGTDEDAAGPAQDATASDANSSQDASQGDAGSNLDAGALDVGQSESDSGVPQEAPTIDAITPEEGLNDRETDVLVTGRGFATGATLKIGQILAVQVTVPGSTTLLAKVPPGIAPGVYDVTVSNPDQQSALLPDAFEVLDASGVGDLPEDDCGCQATREGAPRLGLFGLLLLTLLLAARPRERRRVRVSARLAPRRKSS